MARTTLILWDGLPVLPIDVQEAVSDCVYKIGLSRKSPLNRVAPQSPGMVLAELNTLAEQSLKERAFRAGRKLLNSFKITGFEVRNGVRTVKMRIGVTTDITEDITITL